MLAIIFENGKEHRVDNLPDDIQSSLEKLVVMKYVQKGTTIKMASLQWYDGDFIVWDRCEAVYEGDYEVKSLHRKYARFHVTMAFDYLAYVDVELD